MPSRRATNRQRYQLQGIDLLGSTARNQASATSDIDVWVGLDLLNPCCARGTPSSRPNAKELERLPEDFRRCCLPLLRLLGVL